MFYLISGEMEFSDAPITLPEYQCISNLGAVDIVDTSELQRPQLHVTRYSKKIEYKALVPPEDFPQYMEGFVSRIHGALIREIIQALQMRESQLHPPAP